MNPQVSGAVEAAAKVFNVTADDIFGDSRLRRVVEARHVAMAQVKATTRMSLTEIGQHFGRDHTTVLHALRRLATKLGKDRQLYRIVLSYFPDVLGA